VRVIVIPGLNGHPGLLMQYAPVLFGNWQARPFDHHNDLAVDGVPGLAARALELIGPDERVIVCGESFGGTIALTLAHAAPERVAGLVLFSAFGWYPSMLARRGARALAIVSFLGQRASDRIYRARRLASVPTQLGVRFPRELLRAYLGQPRANIAAYRRKAELSLEFDARPWLDQVACPAFVLIGSYDPVVRPGAGRELARRLPAASLCTLPGGHLVHVVHAGRVGHIISDWAARHAL
jgi:pimeloyl-ACP methyl ester carboxylesterase